MGEKKYITKREMPFNKILGYNNNS